MTSTDAPYTFLFPLYIAARSLERLLDDALAPSGLSSDEFAIYSALARMGDARPSDIAGFLRLPPTTVSTLVSRLVERGHVDVQPDASDGRAKRLRLTRTGAAAHRKALTLHEPVVSSLEAHVGQELTALADGLDALQAALDDAINLIR